MVVCVEQQSQRQRQQHSEDRQYDEDADVDAHRDASLGHVELEVRHRDTFTNGSLHAASASVRQRCTQAPEFSRSCWAPFRWHARGCSNGSSASVHRPAGSGRTPPMRQLSDRYQPNNGINGDLSLPIFRLDATVAHSVVAAVRSGPGRSADIDFQVQARHVRASLIGASSAEEATLGGN